MKLEGYKAGIFTKVSDYKAFILSKVNYSWSWDEPGLNKILEEASIALGELNTYSFLTPNADIYIKMLLQDEANKSSKIDNIDTRLEENLLEPKEIEPEKKEALKKVEKYISAINFGGEKIKSGAKLETNLIKDMHKILIEDDKFAGKLRAIQNWVGGTNVNDAEFVPPPHTEVIECLADFEKFIENDEVDTPQLVKLAMLHYQFETIHPFIGGNGRLGRMIVPLYLQSKGILDKPCLYISNYLEKNKEAYFDELTRVRIKSDIIGWIRFFLEAIRESAKKEKEKIIKLVDLSKQMEKVIQDLPVKEENGKIVLDTLYENPMVSRKKILESSDIKPSTLNTIINSLLEMKVIEETTRTRQKSNICI